MFYVFTNFGTLLLATDNENYANSTAKDIDGFVLNEEEMEFVI